MKKSNEKIHDDGEKKDVLQKVNWVHINFENTKRYSIGNVR